MTEGIGITPTMPVTPVTANNGGDMFGGGAGSWIWILLIFMLLGGRGNLFGANDGVAATPATNLINNDFLYTQSKIDALGQALISQTNQLNQTLSAGFGDTRMGLAELGFRQQQCCCDTLRAVDGVNFNATQNTCAITTAIGASTREIKDLINANTMQDLRDRNTDLSAALSNCNQTATINSIVNGAINARFPYAVPAYASFPPPAFAG